MARLKAHPGGAVYGGPKGFVRDLVEAPRMECGQEEPRIRAVATVSMYDMGQAKRHGLAARC